MKDQGQLYGHINMEIIFELESDIDVEFESDFLRENYSDHTKTEWVFSLPNQGSLGGMCNVHKKSYPKYITYIGAVRM